LANGIGGHIKYPTKPIEFIFQHKVLADRRKDITYKQFVCLVRPKKAEPYQMQFTVGGNRINYPGEVATPTAEMLAAKMLFNSVISMKGARFMTMDISNFYLVTPLHRVEFIQIKLSDIPNEVIREYKLSENATKNEASTLEPSAACTAFLKQDYWPTKSSKNVSTNTDTDKANWYLDFGSKPQDPYSSHWLSMILASNMLAKNMHNISRTQSKNTTNLCAIGLAKDTLG
jgi:hypothetical protein